MKNVAFMSLAVFAVVALSGCGGRNDGINGAVMSGAVSNAIPPDPEPIEGVYPACKYGVVPPDEGAPGCLKPTNRD